MIGSFVHKHGSLVTLVGVLALTLAGCGAGNASTPQGTATAATVGNAGLLRPGSFQWGNDSTGGMPYIVPKDDNNKNGDYYGFEVDIANEIAKLMSVQSVPTQITWSDWPQGLAAQQFDVFMNGLEMTDDNAKSAKFTIPYTVYTQSIVVKKDNTNINTFDDLAGKTVETGTAYKAQFIMEDYNAAHPDKKINIQTTDSPTPFDDLAAGRVDAMFLDTPIAQWYGANDVDKRFKIVGGNLNPGYYGIAVSPTNPNADELLKELNQAIEILYKNGTLQKIYQDGGAYNAPGSFVKYNMWNDSQKCIANFFPDHPTNVSGCPPLPKTS
jgi:polar amino acid transport system substrate-binding protein